MTPGKTRAALVRSTASGGASMRPRHDAGENVMGILKIILMVVRFNEAPA